MQIAIPSFNQVATFSKCDINAPHGFVIFGCFIEARQLARHGEKRERSAALMPLQREPAKQGGGFTRFVNQNVEAD